MDEILKKLLESDLLTEETKAQITEQFKTTVDAFLAEEKTKVEVEVRAQLTEQFVAAREELAEAANTKIDEFLTAELAELTEDINKFRDLEVEYAEKLVEEKERLAQLFAEQLDQLTDRIDAFLDQQLSEELSELKEDIADAKKLAFGRKIFEAVEAEFKQFRKTDLESVEQELAEAKDKLADAERTISEIEATRLAEARSSKMDELLSPLGGNARESMKIILSNVPTEKLDEAFKVYISKVLKETVVEPKKEETTVVTEATVTEPAPVAAMVTGNEEEATPLAEEAVTPNASLSRMRMLAGVPSK